MESPELTTLSCLVSPSTLPLLLPFQSNNFGLLAHDPLQTEVLLVCHVSSLEKEIPNIVQGKEDKIKNQKASLSSAICQLHGFGLVI